MFFGMLSKKTNPHFGEMEEIEEIEEITKSSQSP